MVPLTLSLFLGLALAAAVGGGATPQARILSLTPILTVDAIEPQLPFWERLGFERTEGVEVEDRLVFVILKKDGAQVMLQTLASVEGDVPAAADAVRGGASLLFLEVDDLDAVAAALGDAEVVAPRRTTDYGATEIFVKDPAGNVIGFAWFASR